MKSSQVSEIILIQAIESVDEGGEIISFEERREANSLLEGETGGSPLDAHYERSQKLLSLVKKRTPGLFQTTQQMALLSWKMTLAFVLVGIFLGGGFQVLDSGKKFHVISFPFLGLLLWNVVSMSLLCWGPFLWSRLKKTDDSSIPPSWGTSVTTAFLWCQRKWMTHIQPSSGGFTEQLSRKAFQKYWEEWSSRAGKLLQAQTKRALHLATIGFCGSALLVAYASGLTKSYQATTESTFLGTTQVKIFLNFLFFPSRYFLGAIPSIQSTTGVQSLTPAAPWIHHYAFTLLLGIVIPRLCLSVKAHLQVKWLSHHLPLSLEALTEIPTLNVALASHTNVGKTSLARTLLRRDVGEVRDAEHVTKRRAGYFLINEPNGRLRLWDTPGFGNAKALLQNLRQKEDWGWLYSLQDETLRFDREAALSLREEADLILYLVPAHASPKEEQQIHEEWKVLHEIQCPVICLLNRLENTTPAEQQRLLRYWKDFFAPISICKEVLSLDAFSRNLEDEDALLVAIEKNVQPENKKLASELRTHWKQKKALEHQVNSHVLAHLLQKLSQDSEMDTNKEATKRFQERAQKMLSEAQNKLLETMGLRGEVKDQMLAQSEAFLKNLTPNRGEGAAGGVIGGLLSGLATGLAADAMAGGLTLGGGMIVGGIVGAIGGYVAGEGYRKINPSGNKKIVWDEKYLRAVTLRLTALYLTATSFGRAKGTFTDETFLANPSSHSTQNEKTTEKTNKNQVLFFESAEKALQIHWPFLWPLLKVKHDPSTKKLWEDVLPSVATPPTWVKDIQTEQKESSHTSLENLDAGCIALLNEAIQQLQQLKKTDQTP